MTPDVNALQDTFVYDLLARVASIQRTIQVTTPDNTVYRVNFAIPRWWSPVGNDPKPGFYNRAARISSTPNGRPIRKDVYRVAMRLFLGPAFAGYKGEYEDMGNMLYVATINRFDKEQRLGNSAGDPPAEPLRFVEQARVLEGDNGIEGLDYGGTPKTVYMCLDIPLEVTATFQVYRSS